LSVFNNKILLIDLNSKTHKSLPIKNQVIYEYLGGRGLGIFNLYTRVTPAINPFNPIATFNLFCGPLTGYDKFGGNRFGIFFKSPLTGIFGEAYSQGLVAENIVNLGYMGIIIQGASNTPLWLLITEDGVEFKNADEIWGSNISATEDFFKKTISHKNYGVLSIGPAGEKLVRFASIINDGYHMAARCGGGAILGSKKLKSIVIASSKNQKDDLGEFSVLDKLITTELENKKDKFKEVFDYGELSVIEFANKLGVFPTRYWKFGFSNNYKNFTVDKIISEVLKERTGCKNCPINCTFLCSVNNDNYFPLTYESINAFGGICELSSLTEIVKMNNFCFEMGVDPSTMGNIVGFAIDNARSKKTQFKTKIDYGDFESIYDFMVGVCNREGDGLHYSDGVKIAAKKLGIQTSFVEVKGLEPIGLDPRGLKSVALSMGICPYGAGYENTYVHFIELFSNHKRKLMENKHKIIFDLENKISIMNSLLLCPIIGALVEWDLIEKITSTIFDISYPKQTLEVISNRVITLIRHFNLREGITTTDDMLPAIFYEQPMITGESRGEIVDSDLYKEELRKYYLLRDFDEYGIPHKKSELDENIVTYYF